MVEFLLVVVVVFVIFGVALYIGLSTLGPMKK